MAYKYTQTGHFPSITVAGLEKTLQEAHEVAREKLPAAQKSLKRDYDLHIRTKKYNVGDLVYWRRNAGKRSYPFG